MKKIGYIWDSNPGLFEAYLDSILFFPFDIKVDVILKNVIVNKMLWIYIDEFQFFDTK